MIIFARGPTPFRMGGELGEWVGCEAEPSELVALGKGVMGYLLQSPNGKGIVAEATSGAIIGSTLSQVRDDIRSGTQEMIHRQIARGMEYSKNVRVLPAKEFWERYDR